MGDESMNYGISSTTSLQPRGSILGYSCLQITLPAALTVILALLAPWNDGANEGAASHKKNPHSTYGNSKAKFGVVV
jgi:hypothetical protein